MDSHVYAGYVVPPHYDSMIGKLIAYGKNRAEALRRMEIALEEIIIEGIKTTVPFHLLALRDPDFQKGDVDTHFVEKLFKSRAAPADPAALAPPAAAKKPRRRAPIPAA
jgi:acetyl-CoA carboxylase biotin carboxylase subunit